MNDQNYEKKYNKLMASLDDMHKHNVKKMRSALRSLLIVPTIFLILLFMTNGSSSKTVFLVLWIASLFVIAALLISIEYQDYNLRRMMSGEDDDEAEELPPPELPDASEAETIEEAEKAVEEAEETVSETVEEAEAAVAEAIDEAETVAEAEAEEKTGSEVTADT